jgi:hypothetical protein
MIYSIKIDGDLEDRLREFNAKLPADQKIVSMVPNESYLFVKTEKKEHGSAKPDMHLLTDQLKRGPPR